ncbi:MAG: DUF502 domain-containing protein [Beijerinckiaceae bacterium]|nr:DUF502 domain-containing protein [Beijerinckiaceae bacterium]MCZ8299684.1 DUF502 domain-containing protein [Beijerinckiaceae bacterium]
MSGLMPDPDAPLSSSAKRLTAGQRLRNYFLTGIVVSGPVVITIYLSFWIINWVDGWVKPIIPQIYLPETYLPFAIPGFGILVLVIGLTMLGFLTANLVGRTLLDFGETLLARMPVVRGLYRSTKQIFETIFSQSGTSFRTVGLVEYPAPGCWSIVFLSTPPIPDIAGGLPQDEDFISVFLPCAPNPTTGFFFYVARSRVVEVPISVDDAAKIVMSLGLLRPGDEEPRKAALDAVDRLKASGRRKPPPTLPPPDPA